MVEADACEVTKAGDTLGIKDIKVSWLINEVFAAGDRMLSVWEEKRIYVRKLLE